MDFSERALKRLAFRYFTMCFVYFSSLLSSWKSNITFFSPLPTYFQEIWQEIFESCMTRIIIDRISFENFDFSELYFILTSNVHYRCFNRIGLRGFFSPSFLFDTKAACVRHSAYMRCCIKPPRLLIDAFWWVVFVAVWLACWYPRLEQISRTIDWFLLCAMILFMLACQFNKFSFH